MIAIFDYGAGNLRSVQNTLDELGCAYTVVRDSAGLRAADKILLPGVGHFGQMMRALDELQVRESLIERIHAGIPFFGICLGMQALFETSEEAPDVRGLGIYPGTVVRFTGDMRVPHMGWNQLRVTSDSRLVRGQPHVYFAHSYYVPLDPRDSANGQPVAYARGSDQSHDRQEVASAKSTGPRGHVTSAACTYGPTYTAALESGNVYGVQFHPEKSGAAGLAIVRNFLEC